MTGYSDIGAPDTQRDVYCQSCDELCSPSEEEIADQNLEDGEPYTCPECREGHYSGCVCADCSRAELTADND